MELLKKIIHYTALGVGYVCMGGIVFLAMVVGLTAVFGRLPSNCLSKAYSNNRKPSEYLTFYLSGTAEKVVLKPTKEHNFDTSDDKELFAARTNGCEYVFYRGRLFVTPIDETVVNE